MNNGRRIKPALIVVLLLASGLALAAWTQVWVHAEVMQGGSTHRQLEVTGSTASPALTALALAGLALAGALTIAGVVIRVVLGLLQVLLGLSVFLAGFAAVGNPAAASAAAVTAATGVAGTKSIQVGVIDAVTTPWPYVVLAAAVIMVGAGIAILVTARRWPGPTTRYQAARFEPTGSAEPASDDAGDAVDDWDDLSRGQDPTA